MPPIPELVEDIFRERVLRARAMSPEEKFFLGPKLFDSICSRMREGIRSQFPQFDDAQVEQELDRRLEISRKMEDLDLDLDED